MVPTPDLNNNKWKISFFEEELEFLFTLIMVRVPKYTNQITKSFQVNHPFNQIIYRQSYTPGHDDEQCLTCLGRVI